MTGAYTSRKATPIPDAISALAYHGGTLYGFGKGRSTNSQLALLAL